MTTRLNDTQAAAKPAAAASAEDQRIRARASDAAVKFEAHFIKQMIGQMRSSTRVLAGEDAEHSSRRINEPMNDLADGLVADSLAEQRSFGIADLILKQVLPQAGAASAVHLSSAPGASPSNKAETAPSK